MRANDKMLNQIIRRALLLRAVFVVRLMHKQCNKIQMAEVYHIKEQWGLIGSVRQLQVYGTMLTKVEFLYLALLMIRLNVSLRVKGFCSHTQSSFLLKIVFFQALETTGQTFSLSSCYIMKYMDHTMDLKGRE